MTQVPADYLSTSSYNYDQPFSSVARTSTVTKVPPAKKITFFKSGDPQFAGVKMAINQRSFKSFNALMDDLSHRVPLPFGVRTITTPRGIHCISELDQLEDGGCYLCSDKKYVKPISIASGVHRPAPPRNGRPSSTWRRVAQEGKLEDYSTPFTHHGPRIPKKITLVKNGESGFRRSIILNRRNARSFKTLLDEISEILQFPVKKLYTVDGKKIDSMQALLHCPSTLVCVGREPFKPVSMENLRKHSVEKLPDLAPRSNGNNVNENNEMNFGLKAKKSVIHPRSSSSNRSMRFSLSSEKSYPNGLAASPDNGAPFSNHCSHPKPRDLVHSLVNDDIEKRVHVNKDGSLSVEMKVRFRLLNDETLQWSTQIKKSNLMNQMPCEESGVEEDSGVDPIQKMNPEASSEADESLYPCDIDSYMSRLEESECDEAHCHSCGKKHQDYDIWKNPMHTSQREEPSVRSTWHTRSSCSSTSSRRRVVHKKMASVDSLRTTSSEEFSEHIVQESSSYSETIENRVAYRSIKKCACRSDLSTAASNGEDQHEYTRTSTSNSQRPSSLGLISHSSCENNLDIQDTPEDHEASKTNSQNEDDNCFEVSSVKCLNDEMEDVESSRCGSVMSRSSLQSRRSKKNACEETSSVGRSMSSSSLQKANQEGNTRCSTPANSVHSKSSNCTIPRAKSEQDDHSDDNAVVSSFSSESCHKKEAEEVETEQEENEINEVSSVSAKTKPSQSIKDESSESEQCSTQGSHHSISKYRNSKSGSGEVTPCNASCSSRGSKKSKHNHINLDAQSEVSVSSLESTSNKKNSLHADDLRPSSKTSNYSKSSCEIKKKSIGDPTSHNSGSFHSNISSTSEAEAIAGFTEEKSLKSATNGYSESSKGSKKRSHREENSKPSSLCSSVSNPNGKAEEGHPKMNSESPSSRHGSVSESVCSKGDLSAETGISNGNPASVSSKSEVKDKRLFTELSQESNDRCSQSNISQSSKSRPIKTRNLRVKMSNSSRASLSETLSVCSMHCPVPPKGKPHSRKIRPTVLKNSSVSSIGTESVVAAGNEQKEAIDSSKATSYGSKSAATEVNDLKNKGIDDSCNRKGDEELEGTGTQEEGSDLMPSTLPNTTPEEVVQEWLSKIPSETLIMKYEMEDDVKEECIEATTEVSNCTNAEEISEDEKAEEKNVEEAENEAKDEVEKETAEAPAINEEAEECVNEEQISETVSEAAKADQAECSQSVASIQNNNKRDLPTSVQTSVQIMKALLSSKHETKFDRSNSLPEVSPTMGRKLSNSANILITCLASLQLLDEESEDPSDKSKHLSKSRYMELLSIFQALWFGCTAEKSGPSSGQEASEQAKTSSGFKAQKSVCDFTPMSSSGVDVSSGSGGSAEETTAGARNCTLMAQKTAEFQSAGQEENNTETGTELTEAEEQSKEVEQSSRPSTGCSKSKSEEKAQSTKEESLIQEVEENEDNQCSNCENGQEEGEENANEENSKLAENGEQEDAEAANDELTKESLKEAADQLATTDDTNVNDADCGTELKADLEEQLEKESANDPKPDVNMATKAGTSVVQQNSMDPDPIWVLRLLKKIEKEFMTHYVSAMNEFKVRWNLQNNQEMDEMIQELKEEVSKRIQKSIEKELRKIKSRAGRRIPRPPDEPLKRESTLQTEQRRRRLQTMHKKSLFSDKNGTQSRLDDTTDLSLDIEEDMAFSGAFEASISKQLSEEEYCPCDSCVRKKLASKPPRNPVVATNAPVMKAFDLQKILRLKKNGEEACESEAAQENDEGEVQPTETELVGSEEKEPELNKGDSQTLDGDEEGPQISESQNCEEDEVKDEEIKEEENEEAEEGGEEMKEREEEEKEEEEEKGEEEIMNAEEEKETKEDAEGETEVKDEEAEEEAAEEAVEETKEEEEIKDEEVKEEEEIKEEGETKEDAEEETKEEEEVDEKEEEAKEEEEEAKEAEEVEEEEETREENEDEVTEEDEKEGEKKEEEDMKEEEEGAEDEEEGVQEEEEETKENEEDMKEEEETKEEEEEVQEEEETKEDEEDMKEEEETKEEEEEVQEEEEEVKEDEEAKEEEEETREEEEVQEEEEETKEDEEAKEEEEETREEEEVQEEEEETKEDEEAKEDEEETKQEENEMEDEEENPNEEEEAKDEKEGEKDEAETKEEEEEANEEDEETQNEEHEVEEASQAEEEADNEAEETQEQDDGDIGAEDEKETSECREHADGSGTDNSPEGDAAEGEEAEQDENEAVEDANLESEKEVCSPEEENNSEGGDKHDENDEEPTSDDPEKAEEKDEVKCNKISGKASKAKAHKISKRLETLNKAAAISCYSSVGNFSQQSQKGSEDENEEECKDDNEPVNSHPNGQVQSDESSKPSQMYPDSEEEEEDKASSCTDPLGDEDQAAAEEADPKEAEHAEEVQASKKKEASDEIDQDDLDF